jgi:hypothetical protein
MTLAMELEGPTALDYRCDEAAAAVNAMASGSQHSTTKAMSHLMARSLSVLAPISSAT